MKLTQFFLVGAVVWASAGSLAARPVVALLTDFGLQNEAVGQCHGAILSVDSDIAVVDLSHAVDSYDIQLAALMLRGASAFPKGTVFVTVVDPGVGTSRAPIALETQAGYFYVGPDNGVFSYVIADQGLKGVVELEPARVNPKWERGTFDGRDLFSPAGALIAAAKGDLARVGKMVDGGKLVKIPMPQVNVAADRHQVTGVYLRTDEPYGNVWTNISRDAVTSAGISIGDNVTLDAGGKKIDMPLVVTFGKVAEGKPLAYFNSNASLSFATNMGNFGKDHGLSPGTTVTVTRVSGSSGNQ